MATPAEELKHMWTNAQQLFDRALGGPVETEHDYRGEAWDSTLKSLPKSAGLWRIYLPFDTARKALEELQAKRSQYISATREHAVALDQLANGALEEMDLTTDDLDRLAQAEARYRAVERMIKALDAKIGEAKTKHQRAGEAWAHAWREYDDVRTFIRQAERARGKRLVGDLFSYNPLDEEIARKREQLARYEASYAERAALEATHQEMNHGVDSE